MRRYSSPTVALCEWYLQGPLWVKPVRRYNSPTISLVTGICRGHWEVEALGQLGQGAADNYAPILASMQRNRGLLDAMQGWSV